MNTLILAAGAAALAIAAPALANPGHGHGNGNAHAQNSDTKAHGHSSHSEHIVNSRNGRLYAHSASGRCPPGLARKHNGCMPPGQAKKLYNVGQRYDQNHGYRWTYAQIPTDLRSRYSLDRNDRYYYRNGYLYQVDPRTMMVEQAVSALLR